MAKAAKGRKNSIPDNIEKVGSDNKIDQLLEMVTEIRNESAQRFNKLEDKLDTFEKNFEKIEKDIDTVKLELSRLKPLENKIQAIEEDIKNQVAVNATTEEKLDSCKEEIERLTRQNALLELRQKERILRFRGIPSINKTELNKIMINNLSKYLDIEEDILEDDIDKIIRPNYRTSDKDIREGDVLIFFDRKQTRDEILKRNSKKKMVIDLKEITILKETPKWILNRRKEYSSLTNFLRSENITFKWEEVEGIQFTYGGKFHRLLSVQQAKETLEKIKLKIGN
ncbi:uncharacterized protein LOC125427999 [Sphaerodactylus townsendi]|uniref:uncharacterized protein LOC125427999 n=1 Tax=Sphaerodactylus townsendi TaxID=933632 RepID=UPI00202682CF|nr:uncharacterized protein LOC125427999 [Sphaerodactylus townsendi]XP_048343541.1 uncharacterized protein LOC125427999 [Sphaerodactylus townsendi]